MKVLVVVTRYPRAQTKGDQSRAWSWITHLSAGHEVTVVCAASPETHEWERDLGRHATVCAIPAGRLARGLSALAAVARGQPGQVGWMMPDRAWRVAQRQAERADVVLAMTARSLRGPLSAPLVIDHVDALSLNMRRRARGPEAPPIRLAAALEAWLMGRWERRLATHAAGQLVTAAEDADALPQRPAPIVVPVGLDEPPFVEPEGHRRDIDVVLSGNMRYPPNRAAAAQLASEILPRLRERLDVRAVVVGRAADTLGLSGVEIASDVESVASYLRRSRVAVVPLVGGTGTPYKVLEAAAAGAALVTVPWAAERFGIAAETATDPRGFATAIELLLGDESVRKELVRAARPALDAHLTLRLAGQVEAALRSAVATGSGP